MDKLYVISVISNPVRYRSRYALYQRFAKHMQDSGAILYTVELAFGERPFEITSGDCAQHIQVRSNQEFWHKENLINIGLSRLPADAKYIAWIDADVMFVRPDWVQETIHELQHYRMIQMFSHAQDVGPDFQPMQMHTGFVYNYKNCGSSTDMRKTCLDEQVANVTGHPGYAWAARRETIDQLGGLLDFAVLGSGDNHMARSLAGMIDTTFYTGMTDNYRILLLQWQARCKQVVNGNFGYLKTTINHYWHGKKRDRGYVDRWKILARNNYDPIADLRRDSQGLYLLDFDAKPQFRDDLMQYFRSRNEDSIDL